MPFFITDLGEGLGSGLPRIVHQDIHRPEAFYHCLVCRDDRLRVGNVAGEVGYLAMAWLLRKVVSGLLEGLWAPG